MLGCHIFNIARVHLRRRTKMNRRNIIILAVIVIAIIAAAAVSYIVLSQQSNSPANVSLNGAGATFPYPLINAMITDYTRTHSTILVDYQSVGSGAGINQLIAKTVIYAGSDAPLSANETNYLPTALHIPETIGAVTIAYNLPSVPTGLHLTGDIVAKIYLGQITKWNDAEITALNPGTTLPDQNIIIARRSDSSGTTFVFTGYLSKVNSVWNTTVGQAKNPTWPAGVAMVGSSGNQAVAQYVNSTQYSIGYVELAYTIQNRMTVAAIQNPQGNFIMPTLASTTAAAQSITGLPAGNETWRNVNLLNVNASTAYPIVTFSYLIVYKELNVISGMTQTQATALVQWLWYVVHDGQNLASGLSYAPLPSNVVTIDETTIKSITFNGQTLSVT